MARVSVTVSVRSHSRCRCSMRRGTRQCSRQSTEVEAFPRGQRTRRRRSEGVHTCSRHDGRVPAGGYSLRDSRHSSSHRWRIVRTCNPSGSRDTSWSIVRDNTGNTAKKRKKSRFFGFVKKMQNRKKHRSNSMYWPILNFCFTESSLLITVMWHDRRVQTLVV